MRKLSRGFYKREADIVARELLGKYLVRQHGSQKLTGMIVETEAYLGEHDLACHTSKGMTERTKVMFGPPGHAYIYMIYGMYYCTNVVTGDVGQGAAVLIRALEPVKNIQDRTCGPGLLSRAMYIDKKLNGINLLGREMYIADEPDEGPVSIAKSPRIGVAYAGKWARRHLRYCIKGNRFVSKS